MEIQLSDQLNAVFTFSREEAMRTGSYGIGPDHLLLGIIRHGHNDAVACLESLGVDVKELKSFIDNKIVTAEEIPFSQLENISLSRASHNIVSMMMIQVRLWGGFEAHPAHLLMAIARLDAGYGMACLRTRWQVDYESIRTRIENVFPQPKGKELPDNPGEAEESSSQPQEGINLEEFGLDLTEAAKNGKLDPVQGRDSEIDRVVEVLGRRKKNNPMLVGEPGVGKSAVIEGIAIRIVNGQVPQSIAGKHIFSLDLASVVAGTRFRGDFEKRLKAIMREVSGRDDLILFIDEFHTLVGAGKAEGSLDAANILKPALARGEIQCIGATTIEEFTRYVEKDGALARRFQKIMVEKTDHQQTLAILHKIVSRYEEHHNVLYDAAALEACVSLSERYINSRCLPDKAVDLMDETGSMVRLKTAGKGGRVTAEHVAVAISRMTGIPVGKVTRSEKDRLLGMSAALKKNVVGQDEAIDKVCRAICRGRAGIRDPRRPVGTFLFCGPTGVGKTLLARSLAEYLFDSADNMVRIDMSEYMEKFSASRLVGAPPGYVGYDDAGQLSEPVRQHPYCVVLLDEIEKAHPDIFNLLLQVLDEGRITDSRGRMVSFRNTVIIMTSNAGSRDIEERPSAIGFNSHESSDEFEKSLIDKALRRIFPPEFLGRLDDVLHFKPLSEDDIRRILDIEIDRIRERVAENGYKLTVSAATKKAVVSQGFNTRLGARPLKKAMLSLIEDPVSEKLISARFDNGNNIKTIKI